MNSRILVSIIIIALLSMPAINIQAKTIEKNFENESEPVNIKSKDNSKPIRFGLIFGRTGGVFEHASWSVGFTKLSFENRSKISGYFGFYIIGKLEIGKTYEITASKEGYSNETKIIKLTTKRPIQRINFFMHEN